MDNKQLAATISALEQQLAGANGLFMREEAKMDPAQTLIVGNLSAIANALVVVLKLSLDEQLKKGGTKYVGK